MNVVVPQDQRIPIEEAAAPPPPSSPPSQEERQKNRRAILVAVGIIVVVFVLAGVLGNPDQSQPPVSTEEAKKEADPPEKKTEKKAEVKKLSPITVKGSGSDSVKVTGLRSGLRTFTYTYQDDGPNKGHFSMELLDSDGRTLGLIGNEVGTTKGAKSIRVAREGDHVVNVSANRGSWSLEIT